MNSLRVNAHDLANSESNQICSQRHLVSEQKEVFLHLAGFCLKAARSEK